MAETKKRGFASMDADKQREIASRGGKAAHSKGTAHEFTTETARDAGRKGGLRVSQNREHMSQIGREGGKRRGLNARRLAEQRDRERAEARGEAAEARPEGTEGALHGEDISRGEVRGGQLQPEPPMASREGEPQQSWREGDESARGEGERGFGGETGGGPGGTRGQGEGR